MADGPLAGVRVLTMEQAAALPFATRHLAGLGAEVIRVQSHARSAGPINEADLTAGKLQLGLDLSAPGGADVFRRLAAGCDVVAHNFTPRVVRRYGIDYDGIRAVRPDVVYLSLTGYGTTGPWGERPLFGPGAEAASGHNLLIGWSAGRPGRPGTITYADNVCGLYAAFAVLAALEERDRTGRGAHVDISLYETAVSHLGPVIAEAARGATPRAAGNADAGFAWHGAFPSRDPGRHVVVAATADQLPAAAAVLGASRAEVADLEQVLGRLDASTAVDILQGAGVPAAVAADMADLAADPHLWERDWFSPLPWTDGDGAYRGSVGPAWGCRPGFGADRPTELPHDPGEDNGRVLRTVAGYTPEEIAALEQSATVGRPSSGPAPVPTPAELRIERGELVRVDADHVRRVAAAYAGSGGSKRQGRPGLSRGRAASLGSSERDRVRPVVLEIGGGVGVAYCTKLLADIGWEVVLWQPTPDGPADRTADRAGPPSRWGGAEGAAYCFLDQGKRPGATGDLAALAAGADVVVGDFSAEGRARTGLAADAFEKIEPAWAVISLSAFGLSGPRSVWASSDTVVQAASGLMFLTGEFPDPPTQLAPYQAALTGGVAAAGAAVAAARQVRRGGGLVRADVCMVEALASFTYPALAAYARTGQVARREARVPAGLRMVETGEGWLYCAPGALAQMRMDGLAQLVDEPRLRDERFQTAEGRMANWDEFVAAFVPAFRRRSAREWFERASEQHMTLALVQRIEDLAACPQLQARQMMRAVPAPGGTVMTVPGRPFRMEVSSVEAAGEREADQAWND